MLSKLVENTVGKGEIARYEQFLLFPQCFQKACFIVWEWVKKGLSVSSKKSWHRLACASCGSWPMLKPFAIGQFLISRDYYTFGLSPLFDIINSIINTVPNDKFLEKFKLKAICRWQNKCGWKIETCSGSVENIVGKGENAGDEHFLLFPQFFRILLFQGC